MAPSFLFRDTNIEDGVAIKILVCGPLEQAGFRNAFSTRGGGVSPFPSNALHLGDKEDSAENRSENRRRFKKALKAENIPIITAHQTHSTRRLSVEAPKQEAPDQEADALTTRSHNLLLGVKTADCLPILLADPQTGITAAIHAGWRGTADGIAALTVRDLIEQSGLNPASTIAALGPAACGECYEVGSDVVEAFKDSERTEIFSEPDEEGKQTLNIKAANLRQLLKAGLRRENIHVAPQCTMHHNELFFSHRIDTGAAQGGRLLAVIGKSQ